MIFGIVILFNMIYFVHFTMTFVYFTIFFQDFVTNEYSLVIVGGSATVRCMVVVTPQYSYTSFKVSQCLCFQKILATTTSINDLLQLI